MWIEYINGIYLLEWLRAATAYVYLGQGCILQFNPKPAALRPSSKLNIIRLLHAEEGGRRGGIR